jgi:hypothetical protein
LYGSYTCCCYALQKTGIPRKHGGSKCCTVEARAERIFVAHDSTHEKQQAHELIERLAPSQVSAVVGMLEAMLDPVSRAIANAPVDDEPVSEEEARALAASREWLKHNPGIPHEEVLADFGLTPYDLKKNQKNRV